MENPYCSCKPRHHLWQAGEFEEVLQNYHRETGGAAPSERDMAMLEEATEWPRWKLTEWFEARPAV